MRLKSQVKNQRPADFLVDYFGGLRKCARAIGRSHSAVNKWRKTKKEKGTDGFIPRVAMHRILDLAEKNKWKITAYDLIFGKRCK